MAHEFEQKSDRYLREHLAECTVLLKRDGQFPLSQPGAIAAYGSGVRHTIQGGTGSGEVNSCHFVTVEEGLERAGFSLTTKQWLDDYDRLRLKARKGFIKRVKTEAHEKKENPIFSAMGKTMPEPDYDLPLHTQGDAAIYVVSRISGEGCDRQPIAGDVLLNKSEIRDILALNHAFDHFMLVLNVGGPIDLSPVVEVNNILLLSQLGAQTGDVLADVLLGKANPSGKLAATWSALEDYSTVGTFGDPYDTRYVEGVYVGYRYFDSVNKKALFPFGFGRSYSEFTLECEGVRLNRSQVSVDLAIENIGDFPGKETAQVYVSAPQSSLDKPYQTLAGFAKTRTLQPHERARLSCTFDLSSCVSFDNEKAAYILEAGDYVIRLGTSSTDTNAIAIVRLDQDATVRRVRQSLGTPDFQDWKPGNPRIDETLPDVAVLLLKSTDIRHETVHYGAKAPVDEAVKSLSGEELVYANVGAFDPRGGLLSVVGNASAQVAGAAGETTSLLRAKGFAPLVMADGPAGLRLAKDFYRDAHGAHGLGVSFIPESISEFIPAPFRWVLNRVTSPRPSKKMVIEHQYCTALPIETALAQSWNLDFAHQCGVIVANEMKKFGVDLWLAPALNIQRTIFCGRNFEYYSEDPLITASMATAVVKGVQSVNGCGATIKHYAANNQETNRYGNNSHVSERALREIYLRGFELCIKNASPRAVMTSYNLLNGTHTAERYDLCHSVLRDEFGFEGFVMTDWVIDGMSSSKNAPYPTVQPHLVAEASGGMFMPGSPKDYEDILSHLQDGSISRQRLEVNATYLLRLCKGLGRKR